MEENTINQQPINNTEANNDPQQSNKQQYNTLNDVKGALKVFVQYVRDLVNIADDTDPHTTMANIIKGVEFRGDNIWVLFFAIIIASVGLNMNSTAVIIGAMLISPLMGPIMGLGLAVGINDNELLKKSLKNFGIMVLISIIASTFYFFITPIDNAQSELLARTQPTIYDVFIAVFGGLAGILASSRKQEKVTVVSGVAIATALMPPLCTAGFGLGTGQIVYSLGALYLFFINSFFIALATFVMVRYLHFPQKTFINKDRERKVKRNIMIFAIIVVVPSVFIAFDVVKETSFKSQAIKYVSDIENSIVFDEVQIVTHKSEYKRNGSTITISLVGKSLTPEQEEILQKRLEEMGLNNTKLIIKQASGATLDIDTQAEMLQKFIEHKENVILQRDSTIASLEDLLFKEKSKSELQSEQLAKEIAILFPSVNYISLSKATRKVNVKDLNTNTYPSIDVEWNKTPTAEEKLSLNSWLKVRLKTNKIAISHVVI